MQYLKKVLVLKNADNCLEMKKRLSGLARIEIENGVSELHLSLINLQRECSSSYYALVIDGNKKSFEFDLGERPTSSCHLFSSEPNIKEGFCIGIFAIKDSLPLILSFASDNAILTLKDFKKTVAESCLCKHKKLIEAQEKENLTKNLACDTTQAYDDEAVATENYFEIDNEINEKLLSVKERKNENLQFENELFDCNCEKETQKDFPQTSSAEDEKDVDECQESPPARHFNTVRAELDEIFFKFPEEQTLKNHFKESRWARIYYSSDKYYVVGVIYEEGQEKYICYGVPAKYSKTPPKELNGYCSFIPLSVFDLFGAGYWIMFQDADSGKCVHFN